MAGWLWKYAPTSPPYHAHPYSVSAAEWTPTYPPPPATYRSNAACCTSLSTSPVVLRNTTASNRARFASLNAAASSVATTEKLLAVPSAWTAAIPSSIESCRKPAVLLNTRTSYGASASRRRLSSASIRGTVITRHGCVTAAPPCAPDSTQRRAGRSLVPCGRDVLNTNPCGRHFGRTGAKVRLRNGSCEVSCARQSAGLARGPGGAADVRKVRHQRPVVRSPPAVHHPGAAGGEHAGGAVEDVVDLASGH